MKFYKLQALGNDFIVLFNSIDNDIVKKICDRRFGIGCDQLIILHDEKDVEIYNQDGSDVSFCGNGLRSLAYLQSKLTNKKVFDFYIYSTLYHLVVLDDFKVELSFNQMPIFINAPISLAQLLNGITEVIAFEIVDIGNRNLVIFLDKNDYDYMAIKNKIMSLGVFQDDLNMSFCHIIGNNEIESTIIERGAGFTLSCGSGGLASTASALKHNLVNTGIVKIKQPGGTLIHDIASDFHMTQTGESHLVFDGECYI